MTIDMDFINLFVPRDVKTRKPVNHPWDVSEVPTLGTHSKTLFLPQSY